MQRQLEKILFDIEDTNESLWAEKVGPNRYRLDNNPIFLYGISYGDIVEAESMPDTTMLRFTRVVEKSGNRTIRIYTESPEIHEEAFKPVLDGLKKLGCDYEGFPPRMISINIPAQVEWESVTAFLNERELMWENGDPEYSEDDEEGEKQ